MLILVQTVTPRINYIFNWLITERMGRRYELTTDRQYFVKCSDPKIQYGGTQIDSALYFPSCGLLESTGLAPWPVDESPGRRICLTKSGASITDSISDCFYLLSRYEEYLPFKPDSHGRFDPAASILFRKNLLHWPLADELATSIEGRIRQRFPGIENNARTFSATVTIDIDQAFAYRHKTPMHQLGSLLKTLVKKPGKLPLQIHTIRNSTLRDPYDSYDFILEQIRRSRFPYMFFFLMSSQSRYDPQVDVHNPNVQAIFRSLAEAGTPGIHPSYNSSRQPKLIGDEKKALEAILGQAITRSRQHYLRFLLPETYRSLLENGIKMDYSMGYASIHGFRAGTCSSFLWYDLPLETETSLRVHPATIMEGTFAEYLSINAALSWPILKRLIDVVRQFNGEFIPIWHNHTLSEAAGNAQWKELFVRMMNYLQNPDAD